MAALIIFFYLANFLCLYSLTLYLLHKIQNFPPNPYPPLPIIGHLYLLKKPLHRTFAKLSARHGSILFFWFGSRPVVVVSSPSLAEECLSKNDVAFCNRSRLTIGKHVGYNYTTLTWAPYGDHWRNLRRISSLEILSSSRLQALARIRVKETKSTLRRLTSQRAKTLEMRSVFFELTLNVMIRMIAGKRYYGEINSADWEEAKKFREITAETTRLAGSMFIKDFLPVVGWVSGIGKGKEKTVLELQRKRDEFMHGLIEEHKRSSSDDGRKKTTGTMIGALLALQEKEPQSYREEIIRGLLIVLLIGATETTVTTLEWALSLLLNHPEVLRKAQIEIEKEVGNDRLIDEKNIPELPYLCSIINETLRMYAPLSLALPHESSEECRVGGYRIPRGTMLLVNLWGIQNDPKTWVDPEKFNPERFRSLEKSNNGLKFIPFGSGRRVCPGEGLAVRMVGLVLGSLIQCFEWESVDGKKVDTAEGITVTLSKAQPLLAKCSPRPSLVNLLSQI